MKADLDHRDLCAGDVTVSSDLAEHLNNCYHDNMKAVNKYWKNINWEIGGFTTDWKTCTVETLQALTLYCFLKMEYIYWTEDLSPTHITVSILNCLISLARLATNSTFQPSEK